MDGIAVGKYSGCSRSYMYMFLETYFSDFSNLFVDSIVQKHCFRQIKLLLMCKIHKLQLNKEIEQYNIIH